MIKFFKNMVTDAGGGINSKIFVGLISFFISLIGYFLGIVPTDKFAIMLAFSSTALGWSYLDNKSAIQIKLNETKTSTSTSETNTNIDVDKIVDKVAKKFNKKKK
jgi:hypothetical protein